MHLLSGCCWKKLIRGEISEIAAPESSLLKLDPTASWPQVVKRACRAFQPWPALWTIIPTAKGEKRMQILQYHSEKSNLVLDQVKIEGQQEAAWSQVKNAVGNEKK